MMKRMLFLMVLVAIVAGSLPSNAVAARNIVGRITDVNDNSLQVTGREITTVTLDNQTRYMKWIAQKPWQGSTDASARDLKVGRLVAVQLRSPEPVSGALPVAALVRIATDMR